MTRVLIGKCKNDDVKINYLMSIEFCHQVDKIVINCN